MIEVETMQKQEGEASSCHHNHNQVSPSPSFSSYSSETLAEIAARVIEELRLDPHSASSDDTLFQPWVNDDDDDDNNSRNDTTENDDFEFSFVSRDPNSSPVSADDIFYNGQIKPMYPIFDRTLLFDAPTPSNDTVAASVSPVQNTNHDETKRRRLPLRKLMFEEGETASCSSSTDESVELEGVTEGTYCVWTPNSVAMERKKSNSTGSASKRWKLRNLLLRSQSDGKDKQQPVFQIPSNKVAAKPGSGDCDGGASVEREAKYKTVAKDNGEQSKKKSFLPYKPELVGLFANVNGLGRNLRPF